MTIEEHLSEAIRQLISANVLIGAGHSFDEKTLNCQVIRIGELLNDALNQTDTTVKEPTEDEVLVDIFNNAPHGLSEHIMSEVEVKFARSLVNRKLACRILMDGGKGRGFTTTSDGENYLHYKGLIE